MHKGYTLNYFINFFKNIPDHRWAVETEHVDGTVQKCALGHAASDLRAPADFSPHGSGDNMLAHPRVHALEEFLDGATADINDANTDAFAALGTTPRGRILKALRNRKRTGNVFGEDLE